MAERTAKITFRAKVREVHNMDGTLAWRDIKVPKITRAHCDMAEMRAHPIIGGWANSNMFGSFVQNTLRKSGIKEYIKLDAIPANVKIDESEFLATVTIAL